ncbi:MAG: oligosaccharide flippase family protein [Verrucomicrobia bacterium]|nr:oligosaccharide flippase family protein [Verrucomicrobiota bacterium]
MPFARILRSSALMGGAQVVTLATGFVRTKIVALLIGPSGVGLVGVLTAFNGNLTALAGWGLGTSGVRTIAGSSNEEKAGKIAAVRRFGALLSWLGLLAMVLLFWPIGWVTFKNSDYSTELFIAGMAIPLAIATSMWSALLQAHGQLKTLAKSQVISALLGLLVGLPLIYYFGSKGVAGSILLAAAVPAFITWRAARRHCPPTAMTASPQDIKPLIQLGGALMIVGLSAQVSAYVIRLVIIRHEGLAAAGYYQAAFAIAGSLPGFVFMAMSADFFPRIAAAKDEIEAQYLTEKQIQAGLLLALPFIVALLTMGKLCIRLLYANTFDASIPLLTWMIWGVFLRLISWPMGYWMLARGSSSTVIVVEIVGNFILVLMPIVLMPIYGLAGAATGYFVSYVCHVIFMTIISCRRSGHWLGRQTLAWLAGAAAILGLSQWIIGLLDGLYWGLIPSIIVTAGCAWLYFHTLRQAKKLPLD